METINLETTRDEAFLREVEAESGQKVTNCYCRSKGFSI